MLVKLCFIICSILYAIMAFDLMVNNWASNGLRDSMFLYLFGMVSTLMEMFGKLTDVDGTAEFRYDYTIKKEVSKDEEATRLRESYEEGNK